MKKLFVVVYLLWSWPCEAQELPEETLPPELIHLTTDRPFYFEEERMVFQAVALSHKTFGIVRRNDVLHAELLNSVGEKITSASFSWVDGVANGEIRLPRTFEDETVLYLYVYTPSLLDRSRWVKENIAIITYQIPASALEENSIEQLVRQPEPSLRLFPVGDLHLGLSNQLFYRLSGGAPGANYHLSVKGGAAPDTVNVSRYGVGTLTVQPKDEKPVSISLMEGTTMVWEKELAVTTSPGIALHVETDSNGSLELVLNHNYPAGQKINVEILHSGTTIFRKDLTLTQPAMTMLVPAAQSQNTALASLIIVRDQEGTQIGRRLIFPPEAAGQRLRWLNQRASLPAGATPNLLFMVDADSVDFSKSHLSVKLLDSRLTDPQGLSLTTSGQAYLKHLLRRSGIFVKGLPLEFDHMTATQKEAWLLTSPAQVSLKKTIPVPDTVQLAPDPFQKGFRITGRILLKETGEPLPYCPLALANTTDFSLFRFGKTTADGYFKFENLLFEGENELFLVLQKHYDKEVDIIIDRPRLPPFLLTEATPPPPVGVNDNMLLNEALERSIIDSVYLGTSDVVKAFQENNFISKIAGFFLEPTEVVDPLEYVPFNEMKDIFKEILPTAYLRFKKGQPLIRMVHSSMQLPPNAVVTGLMDVPSLVIVDGVPIFNQEEVLKINPSHVIKYELYHGLFTLGYEVYLGLVHIVTNVDYLNKTDMKGLYKFKYPGISPPARIAVGPGGESNSPYLSPLGFWVSEVQPDSNGVVQLPIRLTSVPGHYWLTLEAITPDGKGTVNRWPLQIE